VYFFPEIIIYSEKCDAGEKIGIYKSYSSGLNGKSTQGGITTLECFQGVRIFFELSPPGSGNSPAAWFLHVSKLIF
jgi:hypothetical protein